jgi:hypothetical protein
MEPVSGENRANAKFSNEREIETTLNFYDGFIL